MRAPRNSRAIAIPAALLATFVGGPSVIAQEPVSTEQTFSDNLDIQVEALRGESRRAFSEVFDMDRAVLATAQALALMEEAGLTDKPLYAEVLIEHAKNLELSGRVSQSVEFFRRSLEVRSAVLGDLHPDTIDSTIRLSRSLGINGSIAESRAFSEKAYELSRELFGEMDPRTIAVLNSYAHAIKFDDEERALPLFAKILAYNEISRSPDDRQTVYDLETYVRILVRLGRMEEAAGLWPDVVAGHRLLDGDLNPRTLVSIGEHATILAALDDWEAASELFDYVSATFAYLRENDLELRPPDLGVNALIYGNLLEQYADVEADRGRLRQAEQLSDVASRFSSTFWESENTVTIAGAHTLSLRQLRQPSRAALAVHEARRALNGWRNIIRGGTEPPAPDEGDELWGRKLRLAFADAAWSAEAGGLDTLEAMQAEAFAALQEANAGATSRSIAEVAAQRYARSQGAGALVRERQQLADQWSALVAEEAEIFAVDRDDPRKLRRILDRLELEHRIAEIDADLGRRAPKYRDIISQPALSISNSRALMRPDEATLLVVPAPFGTHVFAITREGINWHRAELTERDINDLVDRLRADLDPRRSSFDRATAHKLYSQLIAPVAHSLVGKSHVFIAADGALAALPFGVLVLDPPQPNSDDGDPASLRATRWFSDAFALIQIPSLQSLAYLRTYADQRGSSKVLGRAFAGYGDPLLEGSSSTRGTRGDPIDPNIADELVGTGETAVGASLMDVARLRALTRLPGTRLELETIRTLLDAPPSSLRLGVEMTERHIRSANLRRVGVLHIATHGLTATQSGTKAEPGLVFTPPSVAHEMDDGYLAASEILSLDLSSADWIILSACNTAAPAGNGVETGLSGLARPFFYAGAKTLLVSHWPVFDDVAATLVSEALRMGQAKGVSRAQALQQAVRDVRNNPELDAAHPSAWAPFSLVGEGR